MEYREKRRAQRVPLESKYDILGFLASGTYGLVYKARERHDERLSKRRRVEQGDGIVAIKKFRVDGDGKQEFPGLSQSAIREIMINREIAHENLVGLQHVLLEGRSICLIFEYAEHDLLQMLHHHSVTRTALSLSTLKSVLWQLLNGVNYLHQNWILHRDLKPANILMTAQGNLKIGDLGLARVFRNPLKPLVSSDRVVVTVWYRSPELLLGARHYGPGIDVWSIGCIFGELLTLRPMFKGEEIKADGVDRRVPFQKHQLSKIFSILGSIDERRWPTVHVLPNASKLETFEKMPNVLQTWYSSKMPREPQGYNLLSQLLTYDPASRMTCEEVLQHPWWSEAPLPSTNAFANLGSTTYPLRQLKETEKRT